VTSFVSVEDNLGFGIRAVQEDEKKMTDFKGYSTLAKTAGSSHLKFG
jgi:hypothetical protein